MAETIRGVTIKIGADTSSFIKGLKAIDKDINQTSRQAKELQKQLNISYDEKKWEKAHKLVVKDLADTEKKAEAIRKQLDKVTDVGEINTENYQKLTTELEKTETKAEQLNAQLEKINKIKYDQQYAGLQKLGEGLENAGRKTAVLSAAATGALVGIKKLGETARHAGDDIATNAVKYDMSTKAIQEWEYVALQSDLSAETIYKAMTKVRSAFGEQITGNITAASRALGVLGLDIKNFDSNEEGFEAVIKGLAAIEDNATQAAYANDIFGKRMAADVIPLLQQGDEAIESYLEEFEEVGYLSDEQVQGLAELDNVLNEVNAKYEQAKLQLGVALMPIYEEFYKMLEEYVIPAIEKLANWFDGLDDKQQKIIMTLLLLTATLSPILIILGKMSTGIVSILKLFKNLDKATMKTTASFMALAGALGLAFNIIADWKQMSTVEKVLKSLALAALTAAAAVSVFHASWSLGAAAGGIAVAVAGAIGTIKAAAEEIGVDADIGDEEAIRQSAMQDSYKIPDNNYGGGSNTYNEDNSQYNIEINMTPTGDLDYDAKEIAQEVIKEIVIQKQASGRF